MVQKIRMPPLPLSGGCQCGQVRYRLEGAPVTFYLCHCTECQKQSSSAFGESLRVNAADVHVEGRVKSFSRATRSGGRFLCEFCANCGTRLFHGRDEPGGRFNIKAGTLDDTAWLVPAGHIWTRSRQAFIAIGADELNYPEDPPDRLAALVSHWREMIGQVERPDPQGSV